MLELARGRRMRVTRMRRRFRSSFAAESRPKASGEPALLFRRLFHQPELIIIYVKREDYWMKCTQLLLSKRMW